MIRIVSLLITMGLTMTMACTKAGALIGANHSIIQNNVKLWFEENVFPPCGNKRGQGSAHYGDHNHVLRRNHLESIRNYIDSNNNKSGGMVSIRSIRNHLQREFGVRYNRNALYYCLSVRLGYKYAKPKSKCVLMTDKRKRRLRRHWLQRDLALKAQARGEAILVYMDESYIHQNHFPAKCWLHPDRPHVTRPAGKGQRCIIVNAITLDGLLRYCPRGEDNPPAPGEWDSGIYPTAEMVYRAKSARGDYHDQMDCDTFMMWLERRCLPAFEAKYPDKQMILVLDNAPYHHGRHEDGFFCSEHNKAQIAEKLESLGCRGLRIKLDFTTVVEAAPTAPPTVGSPVEDYIGWYIMDVDDKECFEVTHFANDDTEYDQGEVICVTKMGVQRGAKSWFSLDADKARTHGLQTFQDLVSEGTFKVLGYGDETYNRISQFWREYRTQQSDPLDLLLDPSELEAASTSHANGPGETPAPTPNKHHFYPIGKLAARYNGRGKAGTGGPKTEWLKKAGDRWIHLHHPELHDTRLMRFCRANKIKLVFTAPYEFDSQPIENVWRDVKGEVGRLYYPRRTITETRKQLINAFNTRISAEFCQKLILSSENYLNEQISNDPQCSRLGKIGHFVNPPDINASDEVLDFDGIDMVSDEDRDIDDDDDYEDC